MNSKQYADFLAIMALNRIIESKAINIILGKDKRARFLNYAISNQHLKKQTITETVIVKTRDESTGERRERKETKAATYYCITKFGLQFLACKKSSFFNCSYSSTAFNIFYGYEYSIAGKWRMINATTALLIARMAGANIHAGTFCYQDEELDDGSFESLQVEKMQYTLKSYYTDFLPGSAFTELNLFPDVTTKEEEEYMVFHSAEEVKHMIANASYSGTERDFSRGRYSGILDSVTKSMLVFVAPSFTMSWAKWLTDKEVNSYMLWTRSFALADPVVCRKNGAYAVLIVNNAQEFAYHYKNNREGKESFEKFGDGFKHLYVIPKSKEGAEHLHMLMMIDDDEWIGRAKRTVAQIPGYSVAGASNMLFPLRDACGKPTALGLLMDVSTIHALAEYGKINASKSFRLICFDWQEEFYRKVLPDNTVYECLKPVAD